MHLRFECNGLNPEGLKKPEAISDSCESKSIPA